MYSHGQELFYKFVSKITNKLVKQLLSMIVIILQTIVEILLHDHFLYASKLPIPCDSFPSLKASPLGME